MSILHDGKITVLWSWHDRLGWYYEKPLLRVFVVAAASKATQVVEQQ